MLTEEKEDYLKAIYSLGSATEYVSNKQLAQYLKIKPPSVSEMMSRMQKEDLVELKAYKGVKLTHQSQLLTLNLIKRHRLIECFLIQSLNYSWNEVHAEAEVLEHRVSDRFIERLDEMLDYPRYCPHGSLIPRGEITEEKMTPVNELKEGTSFVLKKVRDEYELLAYLSKQDVSINDELQIEKIDHANKVIYLKKKKSFIISFENAEKMFTR
ncbi:metal-dependent transcriptional regulator [Macrococcus brunensis]|uniref:metal-dependent transcriptional regulator n=1 Tax=Macrococcus brunensis TaxID=198483 RepID=UPI001EF124B9|nr:metal-dependent transcriptional regulator [Macrococcus brunensis]ULG72922.1 metal-dependent transcriptional regulator [Macrococcus brunensis]